MNGLDAVLKELICTCGSVASPSRQQLLEVSPNAVSACSAANGCGNNSTFILSRVDGGVADVSYTLCAAPEHFASLRFIDQNSVKSAGTGSCASENVRSLFDLLQANLRDLNIIVAPGSSSDGRPPSPLWHRRPSIEELKRTAISGAIRVTVDPLTSFLIQNPTPTPNGCAPHAVGNGGSPSVSPLDQNQKTDGLAGNFSPSNTRRRSSKRKQDDNKSHGVQLILEEFSPSAHRVLRPAESVPDSGCNCESLRYAQTSTVPGHSHLMRTQFVRE